MTHSKLRVAVIFGGNSNEKETSLDSGRNIVYKLSPSKYTVIPLFLTTKLELYHLTAAQLVRNSTHEVQASVSEAQKIGWSDLPGMVDFVFIGLHGGLGENGGIQGALEMLGIPYNGSSILTSALCMDKYATTQLLRSQGFTVPQALLINKQEWTNNKEQMITTILATFALPIIIKPHDDGCSIMVQKITTTEQIAPALEHLFNHGKDHALVEEFIVGMELTVGVLGNTKAQALPPSQAISQGAVLSIEEKFLPGAGENQTPAPLPQDILERIQRVMEQVYTCLGCRGYARIDCFYQTAQQSSTGVERIIILEVNTLPALTPATCLFHQAAEIGLKPSDLIDMIVQFGLQEHGRAWVEQSILVASSQLLGSVRPERNPNDS
jgi:UDP-N-acetylmuramate--alanine ligase